MPGWLAHSENFVVDGRAGLDRRRAKAQRRELSVRGVDVVHHEVEWRGTTGDFVLAREDEMRAAAQLQNADLRPEEDRAHADGLHEPGGFVQAIRLQNDMGHAHRWAPVVHAHFTHGFFA